MVDVLPPGLRGLMLASFAAAYMSTVATQMNWGSSYLTNDLYRRFIKRDATERHYVMASRFAVASTVVLSLIATYYMDQVSKAWELLLMLGAGTGLVYILRWYWWRINAWSEVSAMASAFVVSITLREVGKSVPAFDTARPEGFALVLITTTILTTITWLTTTLLTSPEKEAVLRKFYLRVRPAGPGWAPLARATGVYGAKGEIARNLYFWFLGVVFVYSIMFTTGALLFDQRRDLLIFGTSLLVSGDAPVRRPLPRARPRGGHRRSGVTPARVDRPRREQSHPRVPDPRLRRSRAERPGRGGPGRPRPRAIVRDGEPGARADAARHPRLRPLDRPRASAHRFPRARSSPTSATTSSTAPRRPGSWSGWRRASNDCAASRTTSW